MKALVLPALLALLLLGACQTSSVSTGDSDSGCAALSEDVLTDLVEEYPLDLLDGDVRDDLEEALGGESEICLVASGTKVSCNVGGGPKPDIRRCCRFSKEPEARMFGLARRIGLSDEGRRVLELSVEASLVNKSMDRRCVPGVCEDDRVDATGTLALKGVVHTQAGLVDFDLPVQLQESLQRTCEG